MNETPKVGERWRVTIEGIINKVGVAGWRIIYGATAEDFQWIDFGSGIWEKISDPEPQWLPGDLVLAADGMVHQRFELETEHGHAYVWGRPGAPCPAATDDEVARPLRRLVVES